MASSARIDELKQKFDENPRRYFAPLANEFRKGGDLDQAILICQEFLPQQPAHMSGHIVYGQALFESNRPDEARAVFETALSLDPENLIALRHLGDIAGQQRDPASARRWYERVLEADPRNDEIQGLIAALDGVRMTEDSASPELLDLDVTVPHGVPVVPDTYVGAVEEPPIERSWSQPVQQNYDPSTLGEIVSMPETSDLMPELAQRADGFESTEFAAPDIPVQQATGLQSAFEDETGIYGAAVAPLDGLDRPQVVLDDAAPALATDGNDLLDLEQDDQLGLPPHGDPVTHPAPQSGSTLDDLPSFDQEFEVPAPVAESHIPVGMAWSAESEQEFDIPTELAAEAPEASPAGDALPLELPPEVIAAEAELLEDGLSIEQPADEYGGNEESDTFAVGEAGSELTFLDTDEPTRDTSRSHADTEQFDQVDDLQLDDAPLVEDVEIDDAVPARAEQRPFVTETMAELYLKQGFRDQALSVYEQLSQASPGDERLAQKVASLSAESAALPVVASGPSAREFLSRFATRRPGERGAAAAPPEESDFASDAGESTLAPVTAAAYVDEPDTAVALEAPAPLPASVSAALDRPASSEVRGGSIDALFGNRPIGTAEDSAASALAQAFGAGAPTAPPIIGNPARQASGELSLDSVFRDGASRGPRSSQGFSFDQFFSQNADGERTTGGPRNSQEVPVEGEPAERSADDIEQFNSWLQGLKQR